MHLIDQRIYFFVLGFFLGMDEIDVVQVTRQTNQGMTTPYICKGDDQKGYVVKGCKATRRGLVNEWVVAYLARAFGLPIPNFKKAYVDDALLAIGYELYNYNFASEFQPSIQDVRYSQLENISPKLLKDLYIFDYWVKNNDRCLTQNGGNPNFFLHQGTNEPFVIDHNLSFDESFCVEKHRDLHVGTSVWYGLDLVDKQHYEHRFSEALNVFDSAMLSMPDEWFELESKDSIRSKIEVVLREYEHDSFWEALR